MSKNIASCMRALTLSIICVFAITAWAVPARKGTFTHTQADGSVLTLELVGDEYLHYYVEVSTGAAMERKANGDFVAIAPAVLQQRQASADQQRAAANAERIQRLPMMRAQAAGGPDRAVGTFQPMTGVKRAIAILVDFKDVKFAHTQEQVAAKFNDEGYNENGHIGSVKDYFTAQSYGNFSIDFDVVGPVTVSENMEYYGANGTNGSDMHPGQMVCEAVDLADTQFGVDYSLYDWDNDGYVDQVYVLYAGYCEAQGAPDETIWPHAWTLASAGYFGDGSGVQTIDGKKINSYACSSELQGASGTVMDGIGTLCHEYSHCLGYPDFYDVDYTDNGGNAWAMSYFDLMASGSYSGPNGYGEVPCGYTAYERWMAGWLTPTTLSEPATITDMAAINDMPEAYIIYNENNSNEYFLLENRQAREWFSYVAVVPNAHGLFVSHVDYVPSLWSGNKVNVKPAEQHFCYVPGDKEFVASYASVRGDFFGGSGSATAFTADSHAGYNGAFYTNSTQQRDVTNIAETNGLISFLYNGGDPAEHQVRYTITLDACEGAVEAASWTQRNYAEAWTLPEPTIDMDGWDGIGWSLTKIEGLVDLDDIIDDVIDYDKPYAPKDNVTLYALYAYYDSANDDYKVSSCPTAATQPAEPEPEPQPAALYYPHKAKVGQPFTTPTLTTKSDGALTYSSSNPGVAEVDEATGAVTIHAAGTAIITVTQAETSTYRAATASYMIEVQP